MADDDDIIELSDEEDPELIGLVASIPLPEFPDPREVRRIMLELQARVDAGEKTGLTPEELFDDVIDGLFPPMHGGRRCGTCVEFMRLAFYEGMATMLSKLTEISRSSNAGRTADGIARADFFKIQVARCGQKVNRHVLLIAQPETDSRH